MGRYAIIGSFLILACNGSTPSEPDAGDPQPPPGTCLDNCWGVGCDLAQNTCYNGRRCRDTEGIAYCDCPPGFEGEHCEVPILATEPPLPALQPSLHGVSWFRDRFAAADHDDIFLPVEGCRARGVTNYPSPGDILGFEPSAGGTYPVFINLGGTFTNAYEGTDTTIYMAMHGFVAANVDYTTTFLAPECAGYEQKAACAFDSSLPDSAISVICARPRADCSKGIVLWGVSQGATMSVLAKNYAPAIRAVVAVATGTHGTDGLFGTGTRGPDVAACLDHGPARALQPEQLLAITGENDEFFPFLNAAGLPAGDLPDMTGLYPTEYGLGPSPCANAYDCLQPGGHGWYIVQDGEVIDGYADHVYWFDKRNPWPDWGLDPGYLDAQVPWSAPRIFGWLMSHADRAGP